MLNVLVMIGYYAMPVTFLSFDLLSLPWLPWLRLHLCKRCRNLVVLPAVFTGEGGGRGMPCRDENIGVSLFRSFNPCLS